MGRPRKNTVPAAAPAAAAAAAAETVAETVAAPILFDDDEGDGGEEDGGEEVQAPPPAVTATTAATTPGTDLTTFIREMQMLRQVMVQQRDEIDQLKSSLYSNQQARVSEQSNALAMHDKIQQLSEQLLLARTMPPVSSSAREAVPPPPPAPSAPLQRQASQPAYPTAPVFRTTPPRLPGQTTGAPTPTAGANPHARLGLINDLPNMRKSRKNHVAELQTGSRYIVKGTNGLS